VLYTLLHILKGGGDNTAIYYTYGNGATTEHIRTEHTEHIRTYIYVRERRDDDGTGRRHIRTGLDARTQGSGRTGRRNGATTERGDDIYVREWTHIYVRERRDDGTYTHGTYGTYTYVHI